MVFFESREVKVLLWTVGFCFQLFKTPGYYHSFSLCSSHFILRYLFTCLEGFQIFWWCCETIDSASITRDEKQRMISALRWDWLLSFVSSVCLNGCYSASPWCLQPDQKAKLLFEAAHLPPLLTSEEWLWKVELEECAGIWALTTSIAD